MSRRKILEFIGTYDEDEGFEFSVNILEPEACWSADYTAAHLLLPLFKKTNEQKQGVTFVDKEDVPDDIWQNPCDSGNDWEYNIDKMQANWDFITGEIFWILEKMIDSTVDCIGKSEYDRYRSAQILLGKYFTSFWD